MTVREIAIENPAAIRVFESFGIDYCCGGQRPLQEACARVNVPVERVLEKLSETSLAEDTNWTDASSKELIAHIVARHHAYVRQEAPRLAMLLAKVAGKHGVAHPELASILELFTTLATDLLAHMQKEEQVLFPLLQTTDTQSANPSLAAPIARMLADHDEAGALTAKIRALASNFELPAGACPSYRGLYHGLEEFERDLHQHVHLENNILFRR
jgi:regulator of cell morphogenesis and NO signaling